MDIESLLNNFIRQANSGDLKTSTYPKEWYGLRMRVSFGMGAPARVPWIAFIAPEMEVSKGYYPVYLYYKEQKTIILAYGVSETSEFSETWLPEIQNSTSTIEAYFDKKVPRYGDSFVFKAYRVTEDSKLLKDLGEDYITKIDLESDLKTILDYYKKTLSIETSSNIQSERSAGLFYMEKQLEDFIIENWENTELGKKYDLIVEEGELLSQQYRTDIGPIDILAKDKVNGNYVVIELKKNQTSDDTVGQLARYMGWISKNKNENNVKGVIIAGQFDQKLQYALNMLPNAEVFLYEVDFKLKEFTI